MIIGEIPLIAPVELPAVLPAREQMAFTLMVHVILVPFGVALPFITLLMNFIGLRRRDAVALQLARRWSNVMAIQFAVGAVTGTVISFEFGLLWPGMMGKWGDVIGVAFGIEGWAFFLEAILIAIYIYGWKRMRPWAHFLVGLPLPFIAVVGAFSILSVNAFMNTPQGFTINSQGKPVSVDVSKVIFNQMVVPEFLHMLGAAYLAAGFTVASVYAVGWLRGRRDRYHRLGFIVPFTVAAIVTPIQFMIGDAIARDVFKYQPTKFAAIELVWKTGPDQPEIFYGRLQPDGTVQGGVSIPGLDSFLAGFSRNTVVKGLSETAANSRPTAVEANIAHFAFDTMVGIASLLVLLALWYGLVWLIRRDLPQSRWFFRAAAVAGVAGLVTIEFGWITAEVGRQPWIIYQQMRVAEAVTHISPGSIWLSFGIIAVVYALVAWAFIGILLRLRLRWRREDADAARAAAEAPPPQPTPEPEPARS
jgi:cytochrome bd ubiquinol oxidase subunit I